VILGVGIMTRAPSSGGKTRLAAHLSEDRLRTLRAALLADTLQTVSAVPDADRVVFFTPADGGAEIRLLSAAPLPLVAQTGADLGARMRAALEHLLQARSCEAAILVGTDMPLLTAEHINEARDILDTFRGVVLGPTDDGGYYLIGMRAARAELFQGVEWGTASVLADTLSAAARIGLEARLMRAGYDVDTIEDLRQLERDLRKAPSDLAPRLRAWCSDG
jgi:rSAM/selenodomain-associated transferase 1